MTTLAPEQPVRAKRGPVLRCKAWRQESILRMLENNLEAGPRSKCAMVARGDIVGPVAFARDHLDAGSASIPGRETEGMRDGSDAITDWALLNALLNGSAGADLIALHGLFGRSQSAGVTIVADGTESAAARIQRVLDADSGLGVLRYADAGYGGRPGAPSPGYS